MQPSADLICGDCEKEFDSAALLLQHFAEHVFENVTYDQESTIRKAKKSLPDLHPINITRKTTHDDENVELEEDHNILQYCEVAITEDEKNVVLCDNSDTLNTGDAEIQIKVTNTSPRRKYQCQHCTKCFGWSNDLKRHILVHTGERPYKCSQCSCSFTRNFLLQKHIAKVHNRTYHQSIKIPDLKPISLVTKHKSRKQEKHKIRKTFSESGVLHKSQVNTNAPVNILCT